FRCDYGRSCNVLLSVLENCTMCMPRFTVLLLMATFVSSAATLLPTVQVVGFAETTKASASAAPLLQRARLRVGMIPVVANATIFVPLEKGYFAAEGIDLEWEPVASTSEATGQLAAGNIDLTPTTMSAALLNAWARGVDIKIVSG